MEVGPDTGECGPISLIIDDLRAGAANASSLAQTLEAIYAKHPLDTVLAVDAGNPLVADAIEDFTRRWAYRLRYLHADLLALGHALTQAADAYQRVEHAIVEAQQ